jgi:hypothetical protein
MLETGIGRAANAALASLPGFTLPGDVSASNRYYAQDLTPPFVLEDGLDATLARHERFRQAGLLLHHTTPSRFRSNRDAHIRVLQALVAERRGLATPEPRGLVVLARGPLLPTREPWPQVLPSRPR